MPRKHQYVRQHCSSFISSRLLHFPHLFLVIFFSSCLCPAVPLCPILWSLFPQGIAVLSMQGLVSFMEPQHIKDIPGDVEVTRVFLGYEVYSVS